MRSLLSFLLPLLSCMAAAASPVLTPLSRDDFTAVALRAETEWRHQLDRAMQVDFHRSQAFRWQGDAHAPARIVSLEALPEGEMPRCALAVEQGGHLSLQDALGPDASQPWSCDGEPSITSADVDGDGVADLLVLYPYRAPSGDRFMLPLVFVYQPGRSSLVLDEARTQQLRARRQPVSNLQQMKQALQSSSATPR
jgi:hypothetical protein